MQNTMIVQLKNVLPRNMIIPEPIIDLYDWIEKKKLFVDTEDGKRVGFLYPNDKLKKSWKDNKRNGGTIIEFTPDGNKYLKYWFGNDRPEILERLCVFAKTGQDGSMAAFWIDDNNIQKIVHLGSGSGSTLVCTLAEDAIDFLRLIAIGYDEICWNEEFDSLPNSNEKEAMTINPNKKFQKWIIRKFKTTIPSKASEIVKYPDEMGNENSMDAFNKWVNVSIS